MTEENKPNTPKSGSRPTKKKEEEKKGNGGKKGLIVAFILILLGVNGFQAYMTYDAKQEVKEKEGVIVEKEDTIQQKTLAIDSLIAEVNLRKDKIKELGGDVTQLETELSELQDIKKSLENDVKKWKGSSWHFQKKVKSLEELLKNKDKQIEKIMAQNDSLNKMNSSLKDEKSILLGNLDSLETHKEALKETVEKGKKLMARNFEIVGLRNSGKEIEKDEYRSRHLDEAKIRFTVLKNELADAEKKTFYLQIQDPDGATIYDLDNEGGKFEAEDKQMFYTLKQDATYNRVKNLELEYYYRKNSDYMEGMYTVNLYAEGHKIGSGDFVVK